MHNSQSEENLPDNRPRAGLCNATSMVTPQRAQQARESVISAKRIAVITKFRFMGDTVVATPFIGQLRKHLPNAEIDLLAAPCIVDTFANCPHLNRIIPVDMTGVSRWQHGKDLRSLLLQGRYDVAFVLNRSLHCAVTTAISKVPVRIGYANELRRFLMTVPIPYVFDRNEVDCHLDMLRSIGLSADDALPDLWITESERAKVSAALAKFGWSSGATIGLQPGANDPYIREWGAEKFARVAEELRKEVDGDIVLMGGKSELPTSERTEAALLAIPGAKAPINLGGKLGLRDALATIGLCGVWLGNDTGLLHCAVAQRVASIGVFGPNKVVRWGYDAPRHRSIVSFPSVPARDDEAVRRALDAISVDEVLAAAREVMREPRIDAPDLASPLSVPTGAPARAPYYAATLQPAVAASPVRRR